MRQRRARGERGASAVEFALVLPVLLLIIGATVDFGRLFYAQNITGNAAREGARMLSLGYPTATADARISQAMIAYQGTGYAATRTFVPQTGAAVPDGVCPASGAQPGDRIRVRIVVSGYRYIVLGGASSLLGGALTPPQPNGTAEMRCGG